MKTIDEQIECAKALLASLEKEKAAQEANAVKAAEPPKAWKPKEGDTYFSFDSSGEVSDSIWDNDVYDVKRYMFGNVYKTREEAEFEVECLKVETELRRYIYEHGGGNGAFVKDGENHYIHYGWYNSAIGSDYVSLYNFGAIYSNSEQVLRDAIKAIGEARIKKYYLGVK